MAAAAPEAAGAAASLGYMILGLVAFLGYIVVRGLIGSWTHSFGFMFEWLGNHLDFSFSKFGLKVPLNLGEPFLEVDRLVLSALQSWAEGLEVETAYFFHGSASLAQWTIGQLTGLADDAADTFEWLIHHHIPKWAKYVITPTALIPLLAKMIADEARKLWPQLLKVVHVVTHEVTHEVTKIIHYGGAVPLPNPWVIPHFRDWYHDITKWRYHVRLRLSRLEKILTAAGFAALMANSLGLKSGRCITRGPLGKVSRALCGLSGTALNDLLGLLVDVLILQDICRVITLLQQGLAFIQPELTSFITAASTMACYGDNQHPPVVNPPALSLPPVTGLTLSLP